MVFKILFLFPGEVLGRSNIYWYRLCNDGTQETIVSERADRNENQNKECETIDENKKSRNKRKKLVIKQTEDEQHDQPIRIESSAEEPGHYEPRQPKDFDHEPTIDEPNDGNDMMKDPEDEAAPSNLAVESSDEKPGRCEPGQPKDFDREPTIDEPNDGNDTMKDPEDEAAPSNLEIESSDEKPGHFESGQP